MPGHQPLQPAPRLHTAGHWQLRCDAYSAPRLVRRHARLSDCQAAVDADVGVIERHTLGRQDRGLGCVCGPCQRLCQQRPAPACKQAAGVARAGQHIQCTWGGVGGQLGAPQADCSLLAHLGEVVIASTASASVIAIESKSTCRCRLGHQRGVAWGRHFWNIRVQSARGCTAR